MRCFLSLFVIMSSAYRMLLITAHLKGTDVEAHSVSGYNYREAHFSHDYWGAYFSKASASNTLWGGIINQHTTAI